MIDTDFTYIKVVEPKMFYFETLGYEIIEEEIEGYATILELCKD